MRTDAGRRKADRVAESSFQTPEVQPRRRSAVSVLDRGTVGSPECDGRCIATLHRCNVASQRPGPDLTETLIIATTGSRSNRNPIIAATVPRSNRNPIIAATGPRSNRQMSNDGRLVVKRIKRVKRSQDSTTVSSQLKSVVRVAVGRVWLVNIVLS